ncbi:MAG: hypothetical protein ILO36_03360 [Abditibacteriota bacterium]|nr:hypothetical protein [Abditibacteriota bacterium]
MKKIITAVLLVAFAAAAAYAQNVGVLDYEKVQDTPLFQSIAADLKAVDADFTREIELRTGNVYLTENEILELIGEAAKNPNSERAKALQEDNKKREKEFDSLSQINPPSDEQKTRIDELSNMKKKSEANLGNVRQSMVKKMDQIIMEKQNAFDAKIAEVCKAVAAEKKLTVVVMKSAVIFGVTVITQQVLDKLQSSL